MHSRIPALAIALAFVVPVSAPADNGLKKFTDVLNAVAKAAGGPKGNLIVNGGFEEPVVQQGSYVTYPTGQAFAGWQVVGTSGSVSPISGNYAQSGIRFVSQSGKQWLDLTGPGANAPAGVQQTVTTMPGQSYELTFWVGNVSGGAFGTTSTVEVLMDGMSLGLARNDQSIPGQLGWGLFRMPVTARGGTTTLTFINRDPSSDNSNGLDSVSLVPASAAPAAAGAPAPVLAESFESPATGNYTTYRAGQSFVTGSATWIVQSGSIDIVNSQVRRETVAATGTQTVDMAGSPGAGIIATTFPTVAGQTYGLTFQYARNTVIRTVPARARVEVLGAATLLQVEIRHDAGTTPVNVNVPFSGNFVADGAMTTLRFTSLNDGNAGITVDDIAVTPAPQSTPPAAAARNLSGEYVYQGQGTATVSQIGDEVRMFFTWTPLGVGPHYDAKGKLVGDTIKGEWYSLVAQKGWFKLVGKVAPNGDIDLSRSDDPINANIRRTVMTRRK